DQLVKNISEITEPIELIEKLSGVAHETYKAKEKAVGEDQMRMLEKIVTLTTLDEKWMDHLDSMDSLKQGIWLRGDKRTVLSEYKKESFSMFEDLIQNIESTITNKIFRVQFTSNRPIPVRSILENAVEIKPELASNLSSAVSTSKAPEQKPSNVKGSLGDLASAMGSVAKSGSTNQKGNTATAAVKIKRNDPCPCGSGKKYKKCGLIGAPEHRG
ncbi:SEC-C domain-containing protein, partial [Patescibacteria group bacterium]|nr:SEC-C domain-containing protein [Patescibacteria group bacterium]